MTNFKSPVRRKVRQRSGFKVCAETTGGECKIKRATTIKISENQEVSFKKDKITLVPIFNGKVGIIAFGGYIFSKTPLKIEITLDVNILEDTLSEKKVVNIEADKWNAIGNHIVLDIISGEQEISTVSCKLKFSGISDKTIGIDLYGFDLGCTSDEYLQKNDVFDLYNTNLSIYIPSTYYFFSEEGIERRLDNQSKIIPDRYLIIKSCNRCGRFLPLDIENERNTISFSNHCVQRAPCRHTKFGAYTILENECKTLPDYISNKLIDNTIKTHFGYQLECKTCKKFFVNSPLNPLRNSTQHREDSLRRRAIEVLVDSLLNREGIYHSFKKEGKEFDVHIWEKFGKKCFKCGKELPTCSDMALDHTMPLSALWPLDKTATCLCDRCNSVKSDKFPVEYYSDTELDKLSNLSGLPLKTLKSKIINEKVVSVLLSKVTWFFDTFLMSTEYQKIRYGKRTADLIYKAIQKQFDSFNIGTNLIEEYMKESTNYPPSLTPSD